MEEIITVVSIILIILGIVFLVKFFNMCDDVREIKNILRNAFPPIGYDNPEKMEQPKPKTFNKYIDYFFGGLLILILIIVLVTVLK